jgi:beta-glucosidase
MSLKEKIWQMTGDVHFFPDGLWMAIHAFFPPIPSGRNRRLCIPAFLFTDGPRGIVAGRSTCFPVAMARGASWDRELEERIGEAMGIEARAQGANIIAAPCINLLRHPAWGRAQETYGEDPLLLGEMGAAFVRGIQRHAMACVKHFAANSIEKSRFRVNVKTDERTLREIYLPHFKRCVDEGAASVMSAYNMVNGEYCGENSHLLSDILKKEWGFQGFVMSDFVYGVRASTSALLAGLDMEMPFPKYFGKRLMRLVKRGKVPVSYVDDAVLRILKQKIRFSRIAESQFYGKEKIACPAHCDLAREAAEKSAVLLKNDPVGGKPLLPLEESQIASILVLGRLAASPNLGDDGSSDMRPPYAITLLEGLRNKARNAEIVFSSGRNLNKVQALARAADVVIVVAGNTKADEGEYLTDLFFFRQGKAGDRKRLSLSLEEERLIQTVAKVNLRTIVVLEGGSAIITESWRQLVPAILMIWYPGMEGGTALVNLLFGIVNPSGKLPLVFPKSENQLPFFDREANEIEYGYYHGYRLSDKNKEVSAFAFGFGLSYTAFVVEGLRIDRDSIGSGETLTASVSVRNIGGRVGAEVIQFYAGPENSRYDRPLKELKGFIKVSLQPGETRCVPFELPAKSLSVWDNGWIVEPGIYCFWAGTSSRTEDLLETRFQVRAD